MWGVDIDVVTDAAAVATAAHKEQVRSYTNAPYINHCEEVVGYLLTYVRPISTEIVAAAWLHDTVEDTKILLEDIDTRFGTTIASYVELLTNDFAYSDLPSKPNRRRRKALQRDRIAAAPWEVKAIKAADICSNVSDNIAVHDPDFARVYLDEKALMVEECFDPDDPRYNSLVQLANGYIQWGQLQLVWAHLHANN